MKHRTVLAYAFFVTATVVCAHARATTSTYIVTETVGDYSYWSGPLPDGGANHANDTDCNTEGNGFYNAMTAAGTGYSAAIRYTDSSVYDTDFYDPDLTGGASDDDTYNFDVAGTAISFVCAHGQCDDWTTTLCSSGCPSGSYCPGESPLWSSGLQIEYPTCINETQRRLITSSQYSSHSNNVWWGYTGGTEAIDVALGEDSASGSFDGAGTNGGANVSVFVNSCGFRSQYMGVETNYMFGGLHSLLFAMPTKAFRTSDGYAAGSDTAQWSSRGSTLSSNILANMSAAVADAWLNSTMTAPNSGYSLALGKSSDGTAGNNPDGCNMIVSKDASSLTAYFHVYSETWTDAMNEANDATGLGYWYYDGYCNYDNAYYGW